MTKSKFLLISLFSDKILKRFIFNWYISQKSNSVFKIIKDYNIHKSIMNKFEHKIKRKIYSLAQTNSIYLSLINLK